MKRVLLIAAAVPWIAWSVQWAGCAHGQHERYEQLQSALREAKQRGTDEARPEEPASFPSDSPLQREALVRAVLERNPNLEAARQAWRAALAEHPQTRSLEDTRASYSLAPASIRSSRSCESERGSSVSQPQISGMNGASNPREIGTCLVRVGAACARHDQGGIEKIQGLLSYQMKI